MIRKNVLIIGGSGLIGTCLTKALYKDKKYKIFVVDKNISSKFQKGITTITADVSNPHGASSAYDFSSPDIVIYLAAYGVLPSQTGNIQLIGENFRGYTNILSAMDKSAKKPASFYFGSTTDVYVSPVTTYGVLSAAAENLAESLCNSRGIKFTSWRFSEVYGERWFKPVRTDLISYMINIGLAAPSMEDPELGPVKLGVDNPRKYRDFIHVEDAVSLCRLTINKELVGPYDIGMGQGESIYSLHSEMAPFLPGLPDIVPLNEKGNPLPVVTTVDWHGLKLSHKLEKDVKTLVKHYEKNPIRL